MRRSFFDTFPVALLVSLALAGLVAYAAISLKLVPASTLTHAHTLQTKLPGMLPSAFLPNSAAVVAGAKMIVGAAFVLALVVITTTVKSVSARFVRKVKFRHGSGAGTERRQFHPTVHKSLRD